MTMRLVVDVILWSTVLIVGLLAFRRSKTMFRKAVKDGAVDFVTVIPRIAIGVIGSGFIAAIVPSELITSWVLIGYGRAISWELPILGTDFTVWRIITCLPIPVLAGALGRYLYLKLGGYLRLKDEVEP